MEYTSGSPPGFEGRGTPAVESPLFQYLANVAVLNGESTINLPDGLSKAAVQSRVFYSSSLDRSFSLCGYLRASIVSSHAREIKPWEKCETVKILPWMAFKSRSELNKASWHRL